jgi:predicted permease
MNGVSHEVVGVVREGRTFPDGARLWVALEPTYPDLLEVAGAKILVAIARARPGTPRGALEAELGGLAASVPGGAPAARAVPVAERLLGDVRSPLLLLQGAVLLVLLAACANAGGMLLTRSIRRGGELAVRTSLGAGRGRVAAMLLYEGLALGLTGGVAGLVLAAVLLDPMLAFVPRDLPRADVIGLDPTVVGVALGLAALTGIVTALAPAIASTRQAPAGLLRQAAGAAGGAPWLRRLLEGLVVGQVALAVLLTAGAGLLLRSFVATLAEDPGFDPARVTVLDVSLPGYAYPDDGARLAFAHELLERAAALPGAEAVALGRNLPITGANMTSPLVVEGAEGTTSAVQVAKVSDAYFDVLRIELVRGGGFGGEDREGGEPRLVVDESVRAPDGTSLDVGDRAHSFFGRGMRDVVGVAGAVRHGGLRQPPSPIVYEPFFQSGGASGFALLVRSRAPAADVAEAARALVRDLDAELPVDRVTTMSAHVRRSLAEPRFYVVGLSIFGGLAILLALAGCQAGLAHRVAARRRELGLRLALGASAAGVRAMVVRRGLGLTALGAVLGLVAAIPAARILESQLYGVGPSDPLTHGAVFLLLLAAGALASDLPARQAAALDPAETLRDS